MLTLVDDYSRATWIYLLQHKTQVSATFTGFTSMILTQFDTKIKTVRTDNGTEFVNKDFSSLLNKLGIQH